MNPSPILKALSSIRKSGARTLLIGGQACVFYGAVQFSRDLDLMVLAEPSNLATLKRALDDLQAEPIAVPPFLQQHLARGHAVHFRCGREDVAGLRVDVMAALRGVADFEEVWDSRTTIEVGGELVEMMGIEDLVRAKKTQRDKDWPMIRRLVDQTYFDRDPEPASKTVQFWLREMRNPQLLSEVTAAHPEAAHEAAGRRPAVAAALRADFSATADALEQEEREERERDREYWTPLKQELEEIRLSRRKA